MTPSLLLSKAAFREMQLTHWREGITPLREALVLKMSEYTSTDRSVAESHSHSIRVSKAWLSLDVLR